MNGEEEEDEELKRCWRKKETKKNASEGFGREEREREGREVKGK